MKEKYVTILLIDALYRCANERCVGILKRGFPCLYSELRTGLQNSLVVIVAATVLHNFALMQKEVDIDEDIEDEVKYRLILLVWQTQVEMPNAC